jgi:hypothetical protein
MATRDTPPRLENFDPQFCGMVCRFTAVACLLLTASAAIALLTLSAKCPGWSAHRSHDGTQHVWGVFIITAPWTFWLGYIALKWPRFAWRVVNQIQWGQRTLMQPQRWYNSPLLFQAMCTQQNLNTTFVAVNIASVFFSALPLFVMASECS